MDKKDRQIYSGIGGQAVIEGIMMKNVDRYSIAVRKENGEIEIMEDSYVSFCKRHPWLNIPFIRGVFSFGDSMVVGMKSLTYSASFFEDDEDSKPSKFELWLDKVFGEKLEKVLSGLVIAFSFIVGILIFVLLPTYLAGIVKRYTDSHVIIASLEGIIRVLLFIIYIKLISRTEDIRRTFQYHGAEHKCINCVEHGLPLTVDNVAKSSKEHKRCGTSFIVYVMLISILLFMFIDSDRVIVKFISRIILIPVIAGISYEVLRFAGFSNNVLSRALSVPGMWMQGLTTKEPDNEQIEVAIAAVEKVFDWRKFEKDQFGLEF